MPRPFAFDTSLSGLRGERRPAPLVSGGRIDRRALMAEAVRVARTIRAGGASWQVRMAIGLRTAWGRAKATLANAAMVAADAAAAAARPAWTPSRTRPVSGSRYPAAFVRGSRLTSHGW